MSVFMFAAKLMVNDRKYNFIYRSDLQQISSHLHSYFPDFLLFSRVSRLQGTTLFWITYWEDASSCLQ